MKFLLFLIYNLTPLHFIAQNGNIELANLLLNNKNVDINCLSVKLLLFHDISIFFLVNNVSYFLFDLTIFHLCIWLQKLEI